MLDAKEIGCRLRELRGNIPRETVADAVGISVSAISMYGERIPRDVVKVKLASYYGRSVQEIFFDEKCHV